MKAADILAELRALEPGLLLADGFDEAVIGLVEGACRPPVVAYDYERCLEILMKNGNMAPEAAREWLEFNAVGAYVGELTPMFVHDWRKR